MAFPKATQIQSISKKPRNLLLGDNGAQPLKSGEDGGGKGSHRLRSRAKNWEASD